MKKTPETNNRPFGVLMFTVLVIIALCGLLMASSCSPTARMMRMAGKHPEAAAEVCMRLYRGVDSTSTVTDYKKGQEMPTEPVYVDCDSALLSLLAASDRAMWEDDGDSDSVQILRQQLTDVRGRLQRVRCPDPVPGRVDTFFVRTHQVTENKAAVEHWNNQYIKEKGRGDTLSGELKLMRWITGGLSAALACISFFLFIRKKAAIL